MGKTKIEKYVGQTRTMNNGMKAKIIAYNSYHNITVQFENGYVKENVHCLNFTRGQVTCPGEDTQKVNRKTHRVGESKKMNNGMFAKIIAYRSTRDMDVQFEDNAIMEHVAYAAFEKGMVAHPDINAKPSKRKLSRIGETNTMNNGMKAEIITYYSSACMDIQFEDGAIRQSVSYDNFIKGKVAHPSGIRKVKLGANRFKDRIGEVHTMRNGMKATIIAYRACDDMDIQFENGQVRKNMQYGAFANGDIGCPKER